MKKMKKFKKVLAFTRLVKPFAKIWTRAMTWQSSCTRNLRKPSFANAHSYGFTRLVKPLLGFTLAEVLITLSILGVVAAITVPSLTNRNTEKQIVTKVKKEYSALAEAYEQIMVTDGPASKWLSASNSRAKNTEILASHFKPYLAIAKDCGFNQRGCLADPYTADLDGNLNAANYNDTSTNRYYKVLLKDGSALVFDLAEDLSYVAIWVDIDGPKGKNIYGKDWFAFWPTDKGLIPRGSQQQTIFGLPDEQLNTTCNRSKHGYACAAWVVYKGNMDYLRKDISWD